MKPRYRVMGLDRNACEDRVKVQIDTDYLKDGLLEVIRRFSARKSLLVAQMAEDIFEDEREVFGQDECFPGESILREALCDAASALIQGWHQHDVDVSRRINGKAVSQ